MKKIIAALVISIITIALLSCDEPLLTELADNRLTVKLHGSYSSDGGPVWNWPGNSALNTDSVANCVTESGTHVPPDKFMLDIAEIRIGTEGGSKHKFANIRQTYSIDLNDSHPFFDGAGIVLKNDDLPAGHYTHVYLYVRKAVFDNPRRYDSGCTELDVPTTYFKEVEVEGFDFNQQQVKTHWDTLRIENRRINRVFPVKIPIEGGFTYNRENPGTLEIRLNVKNFIKRYERRVFNSSAGRYEYIHFYGFSDALHESKKGDRQFGGNMLGVARGYNPEDTGVITGTNGQYTIALPAPLIEADIAPATTKDRGHDCDFPVRPSLTGTSRDERLSYYLDLEVFKEEWNSVFDTCNNQEDYESAWDEYNDPREQFRLPGYVMYNGDITNLPSGDYNVYNVGAPGYGELPTGWVGPTSETVP